MCLTEVFLAGVQLAFLSATKLLGNYSFFCNSPHLVVPSYPPDILLLVP